MAENLDFVAQARLAWFSGLTEEQKASAMAERAAWADEQTKAERLAELAATFQASDTNNDGLLDAAEFEDFMGKISQNAAARGAPTMDTSAASAELKEKAYALFNSNSDGDGISQADFLAVSEKVIAKVRELAGSS